MTRIEVHNRVSDFDSYRAARVKSLFNAENGCNFDLTIEGIDLSGEWSIGAVVGPSGSGKTSIGKSIFGQNRIVDVPAWLRPFRVLSNGEQFRAGLARLICERPREAVVDEFTSVVDRQIARVGTQAFQKAWRRGNPGGKVVILTPHYDIIDWLQPDWVIDTKTKTFDRGTPRHRPNIELEIRKVDGSYWRYFKPHYYLDLPMPIAAEYFIGTVDGELACHTAVSPWFHVGGYRATRLVTMPEWQGAGVGTRFLDAIAQYHLTGHGRKNRKLPTYFHTSHPQLCAALRRSQKWVQVSAALYGRDKRRNSESLKRSADKNGTLLGGNKSGTGYGGHFRAVQGFKYIGEEGGLCDKLKR